jgi:hypothetical protein
MKLTKTLKLIMVLTVSFIPAIIPEKQFEFDQAADIYKIKIVSSWEVDLRLKYENDRVKAIVLEELYDQHYLCIYEEYAMERLISI